MTILSTDVLRTGAGKLLTEALEAEIEGFLAQYRELRDSRDVSNIFLNAKFKPELVLYRLRCPMLEIANRIMNQGLFDLDPPYYPLIFEKQEVWKN